MAKYKVGITIGVFDLFPVGHFNLLERCKAMRSKLIVVHGAGFHANCDERA